MCLRLQPLEWGEAGGFRVQPHPGLYSEILPQNNNDVAGDRHCEVKISPEMSL